MSKTTDLYISLEEKGIEPSKYWEEKYYNLPEVRFIEGIGIVGKIVIDKYGNTKDLI
jgi:hypothetical protein